MKRRYSEIGIDESRCMGCGMCVAVCPNNVLSISSDHGRPCVVTVWSVKCTGCGYCASVCTRDAIAVESYRLDPVMV